MSAGFNKFQLNSVFSFKSPAGQFSYVKTSLFNPRIRNLSRIPFMTLLVPLFIIWATMFLILSTNNHKFANSVVKFSVAHQNFVHVESRSLQISVVTTTFKIWRSLQEKSNITFRQINTRPTISQKSRSTPAVKILRISQKKSTPTAIPIRPTILPKPGYEKFESYLERTGLCFMILWPNITDHYNFTDPDLNATAHQFCESYLKQYQEYYRIREKPVDKFDIKLLVNGSHICDNDTEMIILLHSLHSNKDQREAIRNTWGGASQNRIWPHVGDSADQPKVKIVFVFGVHEKTNEEDRLKEENIKYGDIIQGNFKESYHNMTKKSLLGLYWVSEYCPSIKYLFKCDDDMIINVPAVWLTLESSNMKRSIMGPLNILSRAYRSGKWKISKEEFPFQFYPPYESGSGYAISADLIRPLLNASNYVPEIFIDDVYVTGILGKILKVNHVVQKGFAYWLDKAPLPCDIINGTVLTGTHLPPDRLHQLWKEIQKKRDCENITGLILRTRGPRTSTRTSTVGLNY